MTAPLAPTPTLDDLLRRASTESEGPDLRQQMIDAIMGRADPGGEHWSTAPIVTNAGVAAEIADRCVRLAEGPIERARRVAVWLSEENAEQERVIAASEGDTARAVDAALEDAACAIEVERARSNHAGTVTIILDFAAARVRGQKAGAS